MDSDDDRKKDRKKLGGRRSSSGRLRSFTSDRLERNQDGSDDEENRSNDNQTASKGRSVSFSKSSASENQRESEVESEKLKSMKDRIHKKERRVALNEPEMHIIGEIDGGDDFGPGVCCRWQFDHGAMWEHLGGHLEGQTQVDYPVDGDSAVWGHPLDVHFLCKGMQGWPRLLLQVWKMDEFGRMHLSGYGFVHIPNSGGSYEIEVSTWRPVGTLKEEIAAQFLGTTPQLRDIDLLFSKAWSDRCRLSTTSSGTVRLNVDVVLRNFQDHEVDL